MEYLLITNTYIYLSPNIYLLQYMNGLRLDLHFYRVAVMWLWFKWSYLLRHCFLVFSFREMVCKHKSDTWHWGTWICENLMIINTLKEVGFFFTLLLFFTSSRSVGQWWPMPLIPALGRHRQPDFGVGGWPGLQSEFQDSQGYTEKSCLENKTKQNKTKKFQDTITFLQRHIHTNLHMKITFHVFWNFDNVLQYYGLPNCSLKYSTRKCMIILLEIRQI